ncbi:hypothetical protein C8J56DRAFT_925846 [Mycena floridula]|nr:hypothetical protein C8J56DRAFT_925846 [Mycena floridula]
MHSTFFFSALVAFFGVASASPLNGRAQCFPSFEGAALSVTNGQVEWGFKSPPLAGSFVFTSPAPPDATNVGEFHVQQDGQAVPGYVFRYLGNNNQLAAATSAPSFVLSLQTVSNSGTDPSQLFGISCNSCSTGIASKHGVKVATGCTITTHATASNLCLRVRGADPLFFGQCTGGSDQLFDFVAQ